MLTSSLSELALRWSLPLPTQDQSFQGISIDSRQDNHGRLFVAIVGEHLDGHHYLAEAKQQGAVAALVNRQVPGVDIPQFIVDDTRLALGDIGRLARERLGAKVLALTGSCGKTTTKNLLASICRQAGQAAATVGNLNNDYGVPMTLANLPEGLDYAVIEMGANHQQEIAYLTAIAKPDIALITNIGPVHLEGFGSLAGVAKGKSEIFQGLTTQGAAIINLDDVFANDWLQLTEGYRQVTFALSKPAMIHAKDLSQDAEGRFTFTLVTPEGEASVTLQLLGQHNANNAVAAAAAAFAAGIPMSLIVAGLIAEPAAKMRMVANRGYQEAYVFDDTYNANPMAMQMALQLLATKPGRKIAVIGDMGELGPDAAVWHAKVGQMAQSLGIDALYAVGPLSAHAIAQFSGEAKHFQDKSSLIAALREVLDEHTYVLVKGSRSAGMEQVVQGILAA